MPGWHLDAICEHLEAVTRGEIRNLLINMPPRHMKSLAVSVFWPVWVWLKKPEFRWLFSSYALSLSIRDSLKCRRLIESRWFQDQWSGAFALTGDQNAKLKFDNDKRGYRIATSVGGAATGEGGDAVVCDDPHNVQERESDPIRESTLSWWDQVMSTRLNDPKLGSKVVVMQRVHEKDLSGHILSQGGYVHLCLPAEFECNRRCITEVGWEDPRREPGELLWPARIGPKEIADFKVRLGSAGYAGQFQQSPTPAGGARFKRQWFRYFKRSIDDRGIHYYQLFQPDGSIVRFKVDECTRFSIIDPAGAEKEQNNKPCFTVIGAFDLTPAGDILWFDLYRKNASIPDIAGDAVVFYRQHDLPWIGVERDGLGLGLFQIMRKRGIAVRPIKARGSKEARSETAEILMESGRIYFLQDAVWLPNLQHELELFPVGEFADQVDVLSYAALWANRHTSAARKDEDDRVEQEHTKTMNKQTAEAEKITAAEDRRAAYNPADAWFGYGEDD